MYIFRMESYAPRNPQCGEYQLAEIEKADEQLSGCKLSENLQNSCLKLSIIEHFSIISE